MLSILMHNGYTIIREPDIPQALNTHTTGYVMRIRSSTLNPFRPARPELGSLAAPVNVSNMLRNDLMNISFLMLSVLFGWTGIIRTRKGDRFATWSSAEVEPEINLDSFWNYMSSWRLWREQRTTIRCYMESVVYHENTDKYASFLSCSYHCRVSHICWCENKWSHTWNTSPVYQML